MVVHTCSPNIHKVKAKRIRSSLILRYIVNLGLAWTIRNYLLKKRLQNNLCDGSIAGGNGNGLLVGFLRGPGVFKCDSSGHLTLTSHKNCLQQSINQAQMSVPDTAPVSASSAERLLLNNPVTSLAQDCNQWFVVSVFLLCRKRFPYMLPTNTEATESLPSVLLRMKFKPVFSVDFLPIEFTANQNIVFH